MEAPSVQQSFPTIVEWKKGKDPDVVQAFLDQYKQQQKSEQAQWWAGYHEGLIWADKDPARSCKAFKTLAQTNPFPLHDLALLHSFQVCPVSNQNELKLTDYQKLTEKRSWLREFALSVAVFDAQTLRDEEALVPLLQEQSRWSVHQKEKEAFLAQALELSRKLHHEKEASAVQQKLYEISPRLNPNPKISDYLKTAKDFRQAREFAKARSLYLRIARSPQFKEEDRFHAWMGIRATYKLEQKTKQYLRATFEVLRFEEKLWRTNRKDAHQTKRYHDAVTQYARTIWTEGETRLAVKILDKLEKRLKGVFPMEEVYWLRGRMEEETRNYAGAIAWFLKASKEGAQSGSFHEKILWYLAWNYRKSGDLNHSLELLQQLKKTAVNPFELSKYSYWLARTLKEKGEKNQSQEEFKDLMNQDILGYYGVLAHRELQLNFPPEYSTDNKESDHPDLSQLQKSMAFPKEEDHELIEWLMTTGEYGVAKNYLNFVSEQWRNRGKTDDQIWLELFQYYARAGQYVDLFRIIGSLNNGQRQKILEKNFNLLFPRPYYNLVSASAAKYGVSPELIYSIMRQESAFDPRTRSFADAFGLLQLIPQAAHRASHATGINFQNPEDLYLPELNIPLGTELMRELMNLYHGQFLLTVAAYNASEKAIQSWMKSRFRNDPIEFIEDVPYDETKGYLKLVLRNFVFYSRLTAPQQSFSFPEWCLENLQDLK